MQAVVTRNVCLYGKVVELYSHPCCRCDEWVIEVLEAQRDGFYVEIGANDGMIHSDTLALEHQYGWRGILVEPDDDIFRELAVNRRQNNILAHTAIAPTEREMQFYRGGPYSGLLDFMSPNQYMEHVHRKNDIVQVSPTRLHTLLADAPPVIDYLCLDVEGAELPILMDFFSQPDIPKIRAMTVEFNFDWEKLRKLTELLTPHGFTLMQLRGWDSCWLNLL